MNLFFLTGHLRLVIHAQRTVFDEEIIAAKLQEALEKPYRSFNGALTGQEFFIDSFFDVRIEGDSSEGYKGRAVIGSIVYKALHFSSLSDIQILDSKTEFNIRISTTQRLFVQAQHKEGSLWTGTGIKFCQETAEEYYVIWYYAHTHAFPSPVVPSVEP
jgi:hypothetical protein